MLDPKLQQEMEQGSAMLAEALPPLWRQLFVNLQKERFSELQSMELLKTYILSNGVIKP